MKKLFAGFALLGTIAFASAQTITFDQTTLDYGTVKPGADGHRVFTIKNTGDKPLIISNVQPSCGCTTPEWSKEPIMPGKTGAIKVHYDTNRQGNFLKIIEVFSHFFKRHSFDFVFANEILRNQLQLNEKQFFKLQSELRFCQ